MLFVYFVLKYSGKTAVIMPKKVSVIDGTIFCYDFENERFDFDLAG